MDTGIQERKSLTLAQAAQRLAVSEKTVRRLVDRDAIPSFRVGVQHRVDEQELESWIATTARNGTGQ